MEMKNIEEGNRLIAEFMGFEFSKSGLTARIGKGKKPSAYRISDLHYHSSWNLLMPVIEKIESLDAIRGEVAYLDRFFVSIYGKAIEIGNRNEAASKIIVWRKSHDQPKIEMVYDAVIQFINLYNKEK